MTHRLRRQPFLVSVLTAFFAVAVVLVATVLVVAPPAVASEAAPTADTDPAVVTAEVTAPVQSVDPGTVPADLGLDAPDPEFLQILGNPCDTGRCSVDNHCGFFCMVGTCPWPCGACVYETSQPCSGYCVCR